MGNLMLSGQGLSSFHRFKGTTPSYRKIWEEKQFLMGQLMGGS